MKNFIYDEKNHRLVLVSEIYPTIIQGGESANTTRSNRQPRLFDTIYVWEDIMLQEGKADNGMDHLVSKLGTEGPEEGLENGPLMILPSNDCYIIYGGSYVYSNAITKPKI